MPARSRRPARGCARLSAPPRRARERALRGRLGPVAVLPLARAIRRCPARCARDACPRSRRVARNERIERWKPASWMCLGRSTTWCPVEFPADKANFSGEMAAELRSLVDRELVRVLDLVLLRKEPDGSVKAAELHEVDESDVGELRATRSRSGDARRPRRTSRRSARLWSLAASRPCWCTRTAGRARSPRRSAGPAGSSWPTAGSRPRRCRPRSKRTNKPTSKEPDMPLARARRIDGACSADRSRDGSGRRQRRGRRSTVMTGAGPSRRPRRPARGPQGGPRARNLPIATRPARAGHHRVARNRHEALNGVGARPRGARAARQGPLHR